MKLSLNSLYIVSTPIGNLDDITIRAIYVLKNSDIILCEDTRHSLKLLNHFKIKKKLVPYHKFNEKKELEKIIRYINEGKILSLISDAGTPSLSDPGRLLIKTCIEKKIKVIPIPGVSSITASISISGFKDQFLFYGFLPKTEKELEKVLSSLSQQSFSQVFFIPANKINFYLKRIKSFYSGRKLLMAKEITKLHESFYRSEVDEIKLFKTSIKGELTIVISEKNIKDKFFDENKIIKKAKLYLKKYSLKDVVNLLFESEKINKKKIYQICLNIKLFLISCTPVGKFGRGVDITFDPRTIGMQIDDTIMQKNLKARLALKDKKYFLSIQTEVLDGRIFLSGKVDEPEEKIQITKMAWETKGVRSVKNAISIKGQSNFKSTAKDILITSQLRSSLIFNKKTKSRNYTLETINRKIYIFGIAMDKDEKKEVIDEANKIYDVEEVIPSIYLATDLSRNKL